MNEKDFRTVQNMKKYGGSFVAHLAELAEHADPQNLDLIKETWSKYWTEYSLMR